MANRRASIRVAGETSSTEGDAVFCVQTAALMSKLHHGDHPLVRILENRPKVTERLGIP